MNAISIVKKYLEYLFVEIGLNVYIWIFNCTPDSNIRNLSDYLKCLKSLSYATSLTDNTVSELNNNVL